MSKNICRKAALIAILISSSISLAYGYDDNFGESKRIESKHFSVYLAPKSDEFKLSQQLNIGPAERILSGRPAQGGSFSEGGLADMLDTLFLRVGEALDMNLYSYKGSIKICNDQAQLNSIYQNMFNRELRSSSFYVYDLNTIYISSESFTSAILGHEIAHAIISNYFVVAPPQKTAEILAGYVEYQLRKINK